MQIVERNPPISEENILRSKRRIGHSLPLQYRRFLANTNGGRTQPNRMTFFRSDIEADFSAQIDWFLGLIPDKNRDLNNYLRVYQGRLPSELLPIAFDPGGNLICIAIDGDSYGTVFYWDHDFEAEDGDPPEWRNVSKITKDFQAFLDSLS